jgi:histidyl-tRNA synthetase
MNGKKNNMQAAPAKLPRGFADRLPAEIAATEKMLAVIKKCYELYGFEAVETPLIEFTEALGKFLPDQDRPNEGVFSFKDDDENWLSLRYDLTAPLARYVAENFDKLPKPYRSYRVGYVFRNEKPGPGRYRQFMQFDADTVGAASVAADAELCMMAADTLERLGIARGDYVIKVNNRKVLDGVMEANKINDPAQRLMVLRAIDKYDRFGWEGVNQLLRAGRKDESGDFTKGAGLDEEQVHEIMTLMSLNPQVGDAPTLVPWEQIDSAHLDGAPELPITNAATIQKLRTYFPSAKVADGLDELEQMADLFRAGQYGSRRIVIHPSVVRGLEYYTGPVFEAELTVRGKVGKPVRVGSVGGGGRYDGLVGRFLGKNVEATGFSIGVSRLFSALKAGSSPVVGGAATRGPVVVLVLDKDQLSRYQGFVTSLRNAKDPRTREPAPIKAELYLGQSGVNAQLKYADKRGSICAVIQGSNERNHHDGPQVTIRDLVLGAKLAASTKDRADYLELRANAQFTVPEDQLVESVRKVLARHGAAFES